MKKDECSSLYKTVLMIHEEELDLKGTETVIEGLDVTLFDGQELKLSG